MIANTWELYCTPSTIDEITCRVAMEETADASVEFCKALGTFRSALLKEKDRIGRYVESEVRSTLRARSI